MKNLTLKTLVASLAILAIGQPARSQEMPPPPGGEFDQRQGPPMIGPGMRGGGFGIVLRPEVQKELKLSDSQVKKLRKLIGGRGPGGPPMGGPGGEMGGPPAGGPPMGDPGRFEGPPRRDRRQEDAQLEKDVKAVLSEAQFKRLKEIVLQQSGPSALARRDVADQLGLTEEQSAKIREILESNRPERPDFQGGRPDPSEMDEMRERMEAQREKLNKKLLAVLTEGQKSKWQAMLGKPFKLEPRGPRPPE